ncbi:pyridoxamine 5'-phosphate oxidase [Auraticoccus sp. F435]|uniref:Pyridoxine/pyridoxamine 5'-phosphate oxidase n=1 Tax=Auraticoccus cholistanensis TaxID=2656650 RepID=A0A6A9UY34_9ACTN|nr:pyridoxamine 5'-phosphate oxidase [Auraticoccus cholistanensis]MVA76594.1 pyridoxamine 5'-phosphate oxidase [Auraticoccus cholistanensis]
MADSSVPHPAPADLAGERVDYTATHLSRRTAPADPLELFGQWLAAALAAKADGTIGEPTAMQVATAEVDGGRIRPSVRTVLLKGFDADGFTFFTNQQSRKGRAIAANPDVALQVHWQPFYRAVRVEGVAAPVSRAESEAYFATRPRGSQLGAWASPQSSELASSEDLRRTWAELEERYAGVEVPCPPFWGGYRVVPERIEFWQGQPSRLHDRLLYTRTDGGWRISRLAP